MADSEPTLDPSLGLSTQTQIDQVCDRFERAWRAGGRPRVEDYLGDWQGRARDRLLRELLGLDIAYRRQSGEVPQRQEYVQRFPEHAWLVQDAFPTPQDSSQSQTDLSTMTEASGAVSGGGASGSPGLAVVTDQSGAPQRIGRYEIRQLLGRGSFGSVYLAFDTDLQRLVAIKTPRADRMRRPSDVAMYMKEARIVASLDHPHIVPVHDFGRTEDGLCFVVSKFIEGTDLDELIDARQRPSFARSAEIVATIAAALHHAHVRGAVHRDIKPANILLDHAGQPYVADFGLALTEEDFGTGAGFAGTPAYMSPEQARGEGHLVDGRSDIFSLGIVMYQLLTGVTPFRGSGWQEVIERVKHLEARPPRQVNDTIPKELERICLKAMSKPATDRYTTAQDMADDLRQFLSQQKPAAESLHAAVVASESRAMEDSLLRPLNIVPKGLRSFNEGDTDFYLELLPGPFDREGLPESVRFWKTRIEQTDPDKTFRVGLMYGPSGCGKSSLVKAGLLPRLAADVRTVYLEATAAETESRLLRGLRRTCPDVSETLNLPETLAAIRRGQVQAGAGKVLIVLDQFEQWLHAQQHQDPLQLAEALRQCDAERLQCLLLVRDDFWLAVSRFMRRLEVPLVEGRNSCLVDLFDLRHARKVLMAFRRAFGALPQDLRDLSADHQAFLDQALQGLSQEGRVISVRLALFAEMVKGRPWTPATLKAVGGTEGVGVAFLEESFSSRTAPPEHQLHQKAARAVLKALLPPAGSDLKGHLKSRDELQNTSGYAHRPEDFADLMRILDSETRLLTPVDPRAQTDDPPPSATDASQQYYQLSHDYLVPSLRHWLTRKQKETRRGRAELRLAERAAMWCERPESRYLPTVWELLTIAGLTRKRDWTERQQTMMRKATKRHALAGCVCCWGCCWQRGLRGRHAADTRPAN